MSELVVPASAVLVTAADGLRAAVRDGAGMPALQDAARRTGHAWVESLLDGFLLALAAASRGPGAGKRTAATVRDLGDRVIEQAVRRIDHARVAGFVAFLDAHLEAGARPALHVEIDPALATSLRAAIARHDPATLSDALHATIDVALRRFLDEPLAVLGVGVLTRAVVKVGRAAVGRRTHAEVERAAQDPASAARMTALLASFIRA